MMRLSSLLALCLLPLVSTAAERGECVPDADRIRRLASTCAEARSLDCVPDLLLAIRTGTPGQASGAARVLALQKSVELPLGWAIASPSVNEKAAEDASKALLAACDRGDRAACRIREAALAKRAGRPEPTVDLAGTLTPEAVSRTVRRSLPLAQRCYERRLACDARANGTVRLAIRVDERGFVTAAEIETGLAPDVDACVLASVARWRFPPPEGGGTRVSFPLVFATGG